MPLPQGKLMASEETQANVSTRVSKAMGDLALKGELQRQEKERKEAENKVKLEQLEKDEEIERIRMARIARMKKEKADEEKNLARGHGEVSYITQDEFLPTVTGSIRCVVHFFHREFERCQVVDARLKTLAPLHVETRFARIDAEKAPFFIERLGVRVLPTILCFEEGKIIGSKVGYNGETEAEILYDIESALERIGIIYEVKFINQSEKKPAENDQDEEEAENSGRTTTIIRTSKKTTDDDW